MPEELTIPAMIEAADPDIIYENVDERLLEDEDEEEESLQYEISSYGADYDVGGLVKRLERGDIKVPAFQRGYVWPQKQASRFIESLLLGLPVPGIFLSREPETNKLLVIDGQQRLTTLQSFCNGIFPPNKKEFSLVDVQKSFLGKTYKTLDDEHRRVFEDSIIHATVVKQTDPEDGGSGIYKIFERLNSGGMLLSPQEIRTAIYGGSLSDLVQQLNADSDWRDLFGPFNKRMRDQELIVRFLALFRASPAYTRPMKSFLNDFMNLKRKMSEEECNSLGIIFRKSVGAILKHIGAKAFKPAGSFNAAVFDAILVGIAKRLERGEIDSTAEALSAYTSLLADADFLLYTSRSTADDEVVRKRLQIAISAFDKVS